MLLFLSCILGFLLFWVTVSEGKEGKKKQKRRGKLQGRLKELKREKTDLKKKQGIGKCI